MVRCSYSLPQELMASSSSNAAMLTTQRTENNFLPQEKEEDIDVHFSALPVLLGLINFVGISFLRAMVNSAVYGKTSFWASIKKVINLFDGMNLYSFIATVIIHFISSINQHSSDICSVYIISSCRSWCSIRKRTCWSHSSKCARSTGWAIHKSRGVMNSDANGEVFLCVHWC